MSDKVSKFLSTCLLCHTYTDKKTSEPIGYHEVPDKCWNTVAVDLFGPMPSKNHVVVVQDLASKFPAAKLVSSTSAEKVLPALTDIYNNYGNPHTQISDNGPPFNSKSMETFANRRNINLQKIPPLHPSSNPAETFMRPLGKTMKIARATKTDEKDALNTLLNNYRNTPHPATGISPASMLFRDGERSLFPRQSVTEEEVAAGRERDHMLKKANQSKVNAGKFKIASVFQKGDRVLVRNYNKTRKFDPTFLPHEFIIIDISENGQCLTVEGMNDGVTLKRHPDDIKKFEGEFLPQVQEQSLSERQVLHDYMNKLSQVVHDYESSYDGVELQSRDNARVGRPDRRTRPNPRYFGEEYVNTMETEA